MPRWSSDDPPYDPYEKTEPEKEPITAGDVVKGLINIFTLGIVGGNPPKKDDSDSDRSESSSIDSMMDW